MSRRKIQDAIVLAGLLGLWPAGPARAADSDIPPTGSLENNVEAGESEADVATRRFVKWNEYEGPLSSLRYGAGLLYEYGAFAQDTESKSQFELEPEPKLRDFRVFLKGQLKTERQTTWCAGLMYDAPTHSWLVRESGIMVHIPELWGHFFIGRTKEGFSLQKVMVGYTGWAMERSPMNDATVPILADGVKWLGYFPNHRLLWNLGYFGDKFSQGQSFSSYDNQLVARVAFLPILSEEKNEVLHLGLNGRVGKVNDGHLKVRSRPEAFTAPYFVDSGSVEASHSRMAGWEAYYRKKSWTFGNEYWFEKLDSPTTGDPLFHGGDVVATCLLTGEVRGYNTVGGFFKRVLPNRPVGKGGPGAWELVLRQTYIDLDSKGLSGGKFWRTTPAVVWYLNEIFRMEADYGYGTTDRYGVQGHTQFFQARLQIWI